MKDTLDFRIVGISGDSMKRDDSVASLTRGMLVGNEILKLFVDEVNFWCIG